MESKQLIRIICYLIFSVIIYVVTDDIYFSGLISVIAIPFDLILTRFGKIKNGITKNITRVLFLLLTLISVVYLYPNQMIYSKNQMAIGVVIGLILLFAFIFIVNIFLKLIKKKK